MSDDFLNCYASEFTSTSNRRWFYWFVEYIDDYNEYEGGY